MDFKNRATGSADLEPLLVDVRTACKLLSIKPTKLYAMLAEGALKSKRIGGKRLIDYASIKLLAA